MKRKPDYVFNVWGDGRVGMADATAMQPARWHLEANRNHRHARVTHRILVYVKAKA